MKNIKQEYIISALVVIVAILAVLQIKSCVKEVKPSTAVKEIIHTIDTIKENSDKLVDSLKNKIYRAEQNLQSQKNETRAAEILVVELLNEPPLPPLVEQIDSSEYFTWLEEVKDANAKKDEKNHALFDTMTAIISNQQQQIAQKDILYSDIRMYVDTLAENNKNVENENLGLRKQNGKLKKTNKVLGITAGGLAAILTGALIFKK
jgi:hypothetical protein